MSRFKRQGLKNTFRNARKGLRLALRSEINIRIHFVIGILVLLAGYFLNFTVEKLCILLLTIGLVISAEMLNSAIEFALDAVFHNKYSKLVEMAKDMNIALLSTEMPMFSACGVLYMNGIKAGMRVEDNG